MAKFIQIPALEIGRKGQWLLADDLKYQSDLLDDIITVPEGFETDLASIPRVFVPLIGGRSGKHRPAAIVHDWLWRNRITSNKITDKIFLEAMKISGVRRWRRYMMYWAVRSRSVFR